MLTGIRGGIQIGISKPIAILGICLLVSMPLVGAISTDKIYVGETGLIGGYPTFDYDAHRWGDYIVWIRGLDIYDGSGSVNPDGDVMDYYDPSWIMVYQISTGESWNITPDYDAGLRVSPNIYYHADSLAIYGTHILYSEFYGSLHYQAHLVMYNLTTDERWVVQPTALYPEARGYENGVYGDWLYFTHYGSSGRLIFVYNYKTGEGRRIDDGELSNTALGMDEDFMWFTATGGTPDILKIHGIVGDKITTISGEHIGADIYASPTSYNGLLGISLDDGVDSDSYIIDMGILNITDVGADVTIYWEDIPDDAKIVVDTEAYDSNAPLVWGGYAVYNYYNANQDIMIYDIDDGRKIYFATTDNDEILTDYHNTMIVYTTNVNSFVHNNDARDDYDIYRSLSDTEYINRTITNIAPMILIILVAGAILGAFKLFGSSGSGGMI